MTSRKRLFALCVLFPLALDVIRCQAQNCPLFFVGENLNLVNSLPVRLETNTFDECRSFCEDIPECSAITWVPSCLENQRSSNCYFSFDISGPGGRPVTDPVPAPEQTGCERALYIRDCSRSVIANNNNNINNIGGNENTRNTPVARQIGANEWERWSLWSSCCTLNSNTESQTRKRVCDPQGQMCPCESPGACDFVNGYYTEVQTRQCSACRYTAAASTEYEDICKERQYAKIQDQCDCSYYYECVYGHVYRRPCPPGTRFDSEKQEFVVLKEGDMGFQARDAPVIVGCPYQAHITTINRYISTSGTMYECPPTYMWVQGMCMCLKGPGLPISQWDVMAIVLCDGNSYNANGDGNLAYAGPFNNYKEIRYRKLKTRTNGDNSVCEFDGNSDENITPGLQIASLSERGEILNPSGAFWFMSTASNPGKQTILTNRRPAAGLLRPEVRPTMEFYLNSNRELIFTSANLGPRTIAIPNIRTGEWYCVVVVFDNDATKMKDVNKLEISVYMKRPGELQPRRYETLLATANIVNFPKSPMNIGMSMGTGNVETDMFHGLIDSVSFFKNRVLSLEDINTLCEDII